MSAALGPGCHGRRGLLLGYASGLLVGLGGCGFRPVYGRLGETAPAQAGLAAISVDLLPERSGQLFRQALQERFERFGVGVERRYGLQANFRLNDDPIAVQQDSTVTRIRVVGFADYVLRTLGASPQTLTSGSARSVDGYDVINQQFFASDLQGEQVIRRVAEAVADQVALQLADYFDTRAAPA